MLLQRRLLTVKGYNMSLPRKSVAIFFIEGPK
jgi:hypothetical protein